MGSRSLITEAVREMQRGLTIRECALRFGISYRTAQRYRSGETKGPTARPHKLTEVEEETVCAVFENDEATVYELACVYQVTPHTVRNILKRRGAW